MGTIKTKANKPQSYFNTSYYYILPMLEKPWSDLSYINNTYLFSNTGEKLYEFYISCFNEDPLLESLSEFISMTYNEKTKEYVYRMKISEKYEEDYLLFLLGNYSRFSEEYKTNLYKLLGRNYKNSNIYKVINKDSRLKKEIEDLIGETLSDDAELSSVYNSEKEIYNW